MAAGNATLTSDATKKSTFTNIENIIGGKNDDTIHGNDVNNALLR